MDNCSDHIVRINEEIRSMNNKQLSALSVKPHLTNGKKTRPFVCLFVRLSVCPFVRCVCQGLPSYGWAKRDALYKFRGSGINQ